LNFKVVVLRPFLPCAAIHGRVGVALQGAAERDVPPPEADPPEPDDAEKGEEPPAAAPELDPEPDDVLPATTERAVPVTAPADDP
jgi:hypothetical protein